MSWSKRILGGGVGCLLLCVIILVVLTAAFNRLIVSGVPVAVPPVTGTSASLEDASLSLLSGGGTLDGFVLGAPEGFTRDAFRLDTVGARVRVRSLFGDVVILEEVLVDGARITIEWNDEGKANLAAIYRHLSPPEEGTGDEPLPGFELERVLGQIREILEEVAKRRAPPAPGESTPDPRRPDVEEEPAKRVVIRRFEFRNSQVRATGSILGTHELAFVLPVFHLEDIGGVVGADGSFDERDIGVTGQEAARQVLAQLIPLLASNLAENAQWGTILRSRAEELVREFGADLLGEKGREILQQYGDILRETEGVRVLEERIPPRARDAFRLLVPDSGEGE